MRIYQKVATWHAPACADSYVLMWWPSSAPDMWYSMALAAVTPLTYEVSGLVPGTAYMWNVSAVCNGVMAAVSESIGRA